MLLNMKYKIHPWVQLSMTTRPRMYINQCCIHHFFWIYSKTYQKTKRNLMVQGAFFLIKLKYTQKGVNGKKKYPSLYYFPLHHIEIHIIHYSFQMKSPFRPIGFDDGYSHKEAKYPAIFFKQQLTACVEKIFGLIRDNMKKELLPLLGSCIQVIHPTFCFPAPRLSSSLVSALQYMCVCV